jgi:hypothetical protein
VNDKNEQPETTESTLKPETSPDYGTSTDGAETIDSPPAGDNVENPVGFKDDSSDTEASNIETVEEGKRTSIEEPI